MFKLGLSHPSEHKFKNSFQDTLNPLRDRGSETKAQLYSLYQHGRLNSWAKLEWKKIGDLSLMTALTCLS